MDLGFAAFRSRKIGLHLDQNLLDARYAMEDFMITANKASSAKKTWTAPVIADFRVEDITRASDNAGNDGNGTSTLS